MRIEHLNSHYDLIIIGGGLVGASFACAVERSPELGELSVLLVEAKPLATDAAATQPGNFDARSTALSYGSAQIFQRLGLWDELDGEASAIREILVSDLGHFGTTRLSAEEQRVEALGYVVENRVLGRALHRRLGEAERLAVAVPATVSGIQPVADGMRLTLHHAEADKVVDATLVVLADGGKSPICEQLGIEQIRRDYDQHALITNIGFEQPHRNIAFERFTDTGPLAVLPLTDDGVSSQPRGALVWALTAQQANDYMELPDDVLLPILQARFGHQLGRITRIGEKFRYPLALSYAREQIRPGLVLLGNVAHSLHPVAGQGLNLALRDCEALTDSLQQARRAGKGLGEMAVLQSYLDRRTADQERTIYFTDRLVRLFSSTKLSYSLLRRFGMLALDLAPGIRRHFALQTMGIDGSGAR
ncbi:MAG: 2-octaprenyl-6-methoxyphenyl hydroxylase [Pseudohongiellaceae bacterium]